MVYMGSSVRMIAPSPRRGRGVYISDRYGISLRNKQATRGHDVFSPVAAKVGPRSRTDLSEVMRHLSMGSLPTKAWLCQVPSYIVQVGEGAVS
jgi:hypothetical protein